MKRPDTRLLVGIARGVAMAAALFVLITGGLLVFTQLQGKVAALVNSREVTRLHDALRSQPKNEELKKQIRALDLELRQGTFYRLQLSRLGTRATLAGVVLFLAAAHFARTQRRVLPNPLNWGARDTAVEKKSDV